MPLKETYSRSFLSDAEHYPLWMVFLILVTRLCEPRYQKTI